MGDPKEAAATIPSQPAAQMAYIVVEIVSHFFNLDEDDTDFDSSELRELVKDKVQSVRDYRGNSLVAGSKGKAVQRAVLKASPATSGLARCWLWWEAGQRSGGALVAEVQ